MGLACAPAWVAATCVLPTCTEVGASSPGFRLFVLQGGLRPHVYCLPVLKRERHRQAVAAAATSGEPSFFLGTDSAPHPKGAKVCLAHRLDVLLVMQDLHSLNVIAFGLRSECPHLQSECPHFHPSMLSGHVVLYCVV